MESKRMTALFGAAAALLLVGAGCAKPPSSPQADGNQALVQAEVEPEGTGAQAMPGEEPIGIYTMDDVANHGNPDDCWMVVEGKIYDGAKAAALHAKLKDLFLGLCGEDATANFMTRGQNPPKPHPDSANEFLDQIYIGDLVK